MVDENDGHGESDTLDRRRFLRASGVVGIGSTITADSLNSPDDGNATNQRNSSGSSPEEGSSNALVAIARNTYRYFDEFTVSRTGLPVDAVQENGTNLTRTSPTNVGMYVLSTVAADELGILASEAAKARVEKTIRTLELLPKWNGLFYRWYDATDGSVYTDFGSPAPYVSTVDNGWLTAALIVAGQAYDELFERANALVTDAKYFGLYSPDNGVLYGGYDVGKGTVSGWTYDILNTEPRVAGYVAIGQGDVPESHWYSPYRTFTPEQGFDWTNQQPSGSYAEYDVESGLVEVYEGHYEHDGTKYVPSWGGSMFESLMPSLVLKERELGTKALGENNQRHVDLQIEYALGEQGYPAWGLSPCATPDGYDAFGVSYLGIGGYEDKGIVTPHATFLAIDYAPDAARKNIKALRDLDAYGKYGFYDSVNVKTGKVTKKYLTLDQGMIMAAIANHVQDGVLREYFHQDAVGRGPEDLLTEESFSI